MKHKVKNFFRFKPKKKRIKTDHQVIASLGIFILFAGIVFAVSYKDLSAPKTEISKPAKNTQSEQVVKKPQVKAKDQKPVPRTDLKVPILMFHHIRDPKPIADKIQHNLSVSPEKFRADLELLKRNGYQAVSIDDLSRIFSGELQIKKPVVLTFDDGYDDNFTQAFPDIVSAGMTGNFYIITGSVGKPAYMTAGQLKAMEKAGMTIGSHTVAHEDLAIISVDRQTKELAESKTFLKNLLGKNIADLCYPSGKYSPLTLTIAKQLGYKTGTTTKFGLAELNSDMLQLPRVRMTEATNLSAILR